MASIIKRCDCGDWDGCPHPWVVRYRTEGGRASRQREESFGDDLKEAENFLLKVPPDAACGYRLAEAGSLVREPPQVFALQSAGGLWSTGPDLVRFGSGWRTLLPAGLAEQALRPQVPVPQRDPAEETGLGWGLRRVLDAAGQAARRASVPRSPAQGSARSRRADEFRHRPGSDRAAGAVPPRQHQRKERTCQDSSCGST
jgi:CubicO group peptidase (beta-lactamase class C family)